MRNREQFCTETHAAGLAGQALGIQGKTASTPVVGDGSPSITVISPISKPWGLTPQEIRVASEASHWMAGLDEPLWYAVLADQHRPEREIRHLVRELKSDIVQAQREAGTPAYWLQIAEGEPAYHVNIIFPLGGPKAERLIQRIQKSRLFPGDLLYVQSVFDVQGVIGYCAAERTPQARYMSGLKMAKRMPGSHPLGEGGGDRLGLSKALREDLVEAGRMQPFKRVYAARSLPPLPASTSGILVDNSARNTTPSNATGATVAQPIHEPDLHGLFGLLPEQPVPERPWVRTGPRRLKLTIPEQTSLPVNLPPDVIELMAGLAETHQGIAEKLGVSRPQTTNILNKQFGASRLVVRRVLELAKAA